MKKLDGDTSVRTIDIHEARTHLFRLVDQAAQGKPFVIAKAGKPLVKVVPLGTPEARKVKRLGFLSGQIEVPEDGEIDAAAAVPQRMLWMNPSDDLHRHRVLPHLRQRAPSGLDRGRVIPPALERTHQQPA